MGKIVTIAGLFIVFLVSCQKEFSAEKASGSLQDSLGQCMPVLVSGTYKKGEPLKADSFFVIVQVNITKPGSYIIETDSVNGFHFSSSGYFTTTGIQQVKLRPAGIPANDTLSLFTCFFNNSNCTFSINVSDSNYTRGTISNGLPNDSTINTWQFTDNTDGSFHYGTFDTSETRFDVNTFWNNLILKGWPGNAAQLSRDTIFSISLFLPGPVIIPGNYSITSGAGGNNSFVYANNDIWTGTGANQYFTYYIATTAIDPDFAFTLVSYDSNNRLVKGTFRGITYRIKNHTDVVGEYHSVSGHFSAIVR